MLLRRWNRCRKPVPRTDHYTCPALVGCDDAIAGSSSRARSAAAGLPAAQAFGERSATAIEKESARLLWWPSAWSRSHTKHDLRVPAERGGSDSRSPEGSGRDFAARWGPPALSCRFGACIFLASLLRIYSSCKDFASSAGDAPSSFEIAVSRTCQPSPHLSALSPNIPSWPGTTMV
jgi:hypothetical protein